MRNPNSQGGYFLVFIAVAITVFIGLLSMAVNVSFSRSIRTEMQDAVDSASHAGTSILCSTSACYDDALTLAVAMLSEKTSGGIINEDIDFADTETNKSWTNGDATITVHRGRWWPKNGAGSSNMPYDSPTEFFHENGSFEDFDRTVYDSVTDSQISWQQAYPQLPEFLVSNAVYVKAEVKYKNSFFNIFNISSSTLVAESYAVAGDADEEVCIAPFAIPACALLNNEGEYDKDKSCLYERFFTQSNRYCTEKDTDGNLIDCNLVPGSLYRVYPKDGPETTDIGDYTQFNFDADHDFNYSVQVSEGPPPCPLIPSFCTNVYDSYLDVKMNFTCDFKSSPEPSLESPADFFGVVGMPLRGAETRSNDLYDPGTEESYQQVFQRLVSDPSFCFGAKIGDNFEILNDGLQDIVTAADFQSLLDLNTATEESFNSKFDVIYNTLLPKNPDFMPESGSDGTPDLDSLHSSLGCATTQTRHGICNSQVFKYDTQCMTEQSMFNTAPSTTTYIGKALYSENMLACPLDDDEGLIHVASNNDFHEVRDPTPFLTNQARTWTIAVPIIAAKGSGQSGGTCAGILSRPAPDPLLDQTGTYTIVGFTRVTFYDHDIGMDPPRRGYIPPSSESQTIRDQYHARNDHWTNSLWSTEEQPWGFQNFETEVYEEDLPLDDPDILNCNMVKATQTCDQGLISAPQNVSEGNRKVKITVPF